MRDHGNDREPGDHKPVLPRNAEQRDGGKVANAAAAAANGQRAAIGPSGALGLQRTVGNAAVTSLLSAAPVDATIQREHSGSEPEAPMHESNGEGEEEI